MSGIVRSLQLLQISLRENLMRGKRPAAMEGAVSAQSFDAGLFEIGAGLRDITALEFGDCLAFVHLLAGNECHVEKPAAERGVNMYNVIRVCFDASRYDQRIVDWLLVNSTDLDVGYGWLALF